MTPAKTSFRWEKILSEAKIDALDANLVAVLGQNLELVPQTVLEMGVLERFNRPGAIDIKAVLGYHKAQGGGQMGVAHARRPKEYLAGRSFALLCPCLRRGLRPLQSFSAPRFAGLARGPQWKGDKRLGAA